MPRKYERKKLVGARTAYAPSNQVNAKIKTSTKKYLVQIAQRENVSLSAIVTAIVEESMPRFKKKHPLTPPATKKFKAL